MRAVLRFERRFSQDSRDILNFEAQNNLTMNYNLAIFVLFVGLGTGQFLEPAERLGANWDAARSNGSGDPLSGNDLQPRQELYCVVPGHFLCSGKSSLNPKLL